MDKTTEKMHHSGMYNDNSRKVRLLVPDVKSEFHSYRYPVLIPKTRVLNDKDFIIRMLYKDIY